MKRITVALAAQPYDVVVGLGLDLTAALPALPADAERALVVTQAPVVAAGHTDAVVAALQDEGLVVRVVEVPDGDACKTAEVLAHLWETAAELPLGRRDVVVAVGGGAVGDLAGFLAATVNRGIAVVQVPTTLLAQVDAAIGGKTGINLAQGKNLVGAFHQPLGVVADVGALRTLDPRIRTEGLGEVVKYGLIRDPSVLETCEQDADLVRAGDPATLRSLVERSVAVKAAVVAADEREAGERAHLNLGHTYGHAVETLTDHAVLHGEAVAIGTAVALHLGRRLGLTPPALVERGVAALRRLGLPTTPPALDRDAVWRILARDKKAVRGVRFVVLEGLARPTLVRPDPAEVDAAIADAASDAPDEETNP
ncbi:MAG: 3-dehydroquinate synthase [Actinomycetes bacterium]